MGGRIITNNFALKSGLTEYHNSSKAEAMNKADYFGEVFGNSKSRNPLQVITNMFK